MSFFDVIDGIALLGDLARGYAAVFSTSPLHGRASIFRWTSLIALAAVIILGIIYTLPGSELFSPYLGLVVLICCVISIFSAGLCADELSILKKDEST